VWINRIHGTNILFRDRVFIAFKKEYRLIAICIIAIILGCYNILLEIPIFFLCIYSLDLEIRVTLKRFIVFRRRVDRARLFRRRLIGQGLYALVINFIVNINHSK